MLTSANAGNYQAAKWFADKGWAQRQAGRPTKAELEGHKEMETRLSAEFNDDVVRLFQRS